MENHQIKAKWKIFQNRWYLFSHSPLFNNDLLNLSCLDHLIWLNDFKNFKRHDFMTYP